MCKGLGSSITFVSYKICLAVNFSCPCYAFIETQQQAFDLLLHFLDISIQMMPIQNVPSVLPVQNDIQLPRNLQESSRLYLIIQ